MKKGMLFLLIFIFVGMFFMSCDRGSKSLTYVDEEIGFSFEYPFWIIINERKRTNRLVYLNMVLFIYNHGHLLPIY